MKKLEKETLGKRNLPKEASQLPDISPNDLSSEILYMKEAWKRDLMGSAPFSCGRTFRIRMKLRSQVTSSGSSTTWTWEL